MTALNDYQQAYTDLSYHFWDGVKQRTRPTQIGFVSKEHAEHASPPMPQFVINYVEAQHTAYPNTPAMWERCQFINVLYWHWKMNGDPTVATRIQADFNSLYAPGVFDTFKLADASYGVLLTTCDDFTWIARYYWQVFEVTGDQRALDLCKTIIPSGMSWFADPETSNPYSGLIYDRGYDGPGTQYDREPVHTSGLYDATLAITCLDLYRHTGQSIWLARAIDTFGWINTRMKAPVTSADPTWSGAFYGDLDLKKFLPNSAPNPNWLKPIGSERPGPWAFTDQVTRGASLSYIAGCMGVGVLAARLHRLTKTQLYKDVAVGSANGLISIFGRSANRGLVNDRDGWTDGYFFPQYLAEVLSLEGVDPNRTLRSLFEQTAQRVAALRTTDGSLRTGYYGADWSGPEWDQATRWQTWEAQARQTSAPLNNGSSMAVADQMTTSSTSVSTILSSAMLETYIGRSRNEAGPSVSMDPDRVDYFGAGPDGMLRRSTKLGNQSNWTSKSLIHSVDGEAVAVSLKPGTSDIFVRKGGTLQHIYCNRLGEGGLESLGGPTTYGRPTAVAVFGNRWDAFVRGSDNKLYHIWSDERGWSSWQEVQGASGLTSDPGATVRDGNELNVFYVGPNRSLVRVSKRTHESNWTSRDFGGYLYSRPAVCSMNRNRLDVIYLGGGNSVFHTTLNLSSSPSERVHHSLGGTAGTTPGLTSWSDGRLDLCVVGTNGKVYHRAYWTNTDWDGQYHDRGGSVVAAPYMNSLASGEFDVYVVDINKYAQRLTGYDSGTFIGYTNTGIQATATTGLI